MLAGWLRKLEPLGHGNPEPIFVARNVRLLSSPRIMKDRHLRLELAQDEGAAATRAVGWDMAARSAELGLTQGSRIDVAYRIRENLHPDFGGLEIEIAGIQAPSRLGSLPQRKKAHGIPRAFMVASRPLREYWSSVLFGCLLIVLRLRPRLLMLRRGPRLVPRLLIIAVRLLLLRLRLPRGLLLLVALELRPALSATVYVAVVVVERICCCGLTLLCAP